MATADATTGFRRWLAFVLTVLCLPAFALAADCACGLSVDNLPGEVAPVCGSGTGAGCCTDCCGYEQQALPTKAPRTPKLSLHGLAGIFFGNNLCAGSRLAAPVQELNKRGNDGLVSAAEGNVLAPVARTIGLPGLALPNGVSPPPPESRRIVLQRCRPGNAPPVS